MFTAGFAEMDAAGAAAQEQLVGRAARTACGCSGRIASACSTPASASTRSSPRASRAAGRARAASASRASPAPTARIFSPRRATGGIGTPICVTTGNEADVTLGDVIGWMAEDPDTDVIAAYAEGIREAEQLPCRSGGGARRRASRS